MVKNARNLGDDHPVLNLVVSRQGKTQPIVSSGANHGRQRRAWTRPQIAVAIGKKNRVKKSMGYKKLGDKKRAAQPALFTNFSSLSLGDLRKVLRSKEKFDENRRIFAEENARVSESNRKIREIYETETKTINHWWTTVFIPLEDRKKYVEREIEHQRIGLISQLGIASGLVSKPIKFRGMDLKDSHDTHRLIGEYEALEKKLLAVRQTKPRDSFGGRIPEYKQSPNPPRQDQPFSIGGARVRIDLSSISPSVLSTLIAEKIAADTASKEKLAQLKARVASGEKETRQQAKKYSSDFQNQKKIVSECPYCGGALNESDSHLDHIYPVSKGGQSVLRNLVFVCAKCNLQKKNHTLRSYLLSANLDSNLVHLRLEKLNKDF